MNTKMMEIIVVILAAIYGVLEVFFGEENVILTEE